MATSRALFVLAVAAAVAVAGCSGGSVGGDAGSRGAPREAASPSGPPCPRELPPPSVGSSVVGTLEPAETAPELPAPARAWRCVYRGAETAERRGETWTWERAGAPSEVTGADLERHVEALRGLEPAEADRVCTFDLGPRTLLVLEHDTGRVGVLVDLFGCGSVRLTDDPVDVPAGEATSDGIVAGVLSAPSQLRDLVGPLRRE